MSQSDRAIKKLATELARLKSEVVSWRGAQADYTSIEGGTMDINDSDGNLVSRVGYQEDGSGATRFFDGPIPPVPSGVTASSDGPIIQATWDGTFEGGAEATYDLAYLEVAATQIDDDTNVSFATITAKEGASASVVADVTGDWVVAVRSVSQAGKKSEFATAGTVEVKLTDVAGAIEAVQDSANGKNKVTYSSHAPTPDDPGIFDDTWFVGQVGRPSDVVEATNLAHNPAFATLLDQNVEGDIRNLAGATLSISGDWASSGETSLKIDGSTRTADYSGAYLNYSPPRSTPDFTGKTFTVGIDFHIDAPQTGSLYSRPRSFLIGWYNSAGTANYMAGAGQWPQAPNTAGTHRLTQVVNLPSSEGVYGWFVRIHDGSAGVSYWDSMTIEEGVTSGAPFDGDTPSGATDNESHYRWTGTPHASTSEKYLPALDIGESSNWNIIEQYRHDGTGWVRVELSHHVFSTVDLGKATVGELDGVRIMGKTVRGEQLSGDAIDGKVITGATYRTSGGNGSWSDDGLFIAKPDGTSMVRFPTDGSPLSLTASDTQIERASIGELDVSNGAVRSGGQFTLASGVTAPPSPPELTTGWQKVCTLDTPASELTYDWLDLGYWSEGSGHWVRAVNVLGSEGDGYDRIEVYDYATGDFQNSILTGLNPRSGVTVIGDVAYVMGPDYLKSNIGKQWVHGFDLNTGERVTRWEFVNFFDPKQAKVALGSDGTNLVAAGVAPNLSLNVFRYNPSTGAQVGSQWSTAQDWPASGGKDLYGVRVNGNEVEVVTSWGGRVYTNNNNVLTRKPDSVNASGWAGWVLPSRDAAGADWVDGHPFVVNVSGVVFEGSTRASDYTAEVCYTWYDGTHETTPSPVASINVAARETVTISLPYREGLQKRVYTREGARWRRNTLAPETTVADIYTGALVFGLPTTNSFPNDVPAVLKSTNDKFEVKGDGSGHWGPLTFNADGSMSGIRKTSSGTLTVSAPSDGGTTSTWVMFPEGRFTTAPTVTTSLRSTAPNSSSVSTGGATATGFYIYFYRVNDNPTGVNWIAAEEG